MYCAQRTSSHPLGLSAKEALPLRVDRRPTISRLNELYPAIPSGMVVPNLGFLYLALMDTSGSATVIAPPIITASPNGLCANIWLCRKINLIQESTCLVENIIVYVVVADILAVMVYAHRVTHTTVYTIPHRYDGF